MPLVPVILQRISPVSHVDVLTMESVNLDLHANMSTNVPTVSSMVTPF